VRKSGEKTVTRQKDFFGPKTDALIVGSLGLCSFGLWSLVFGFSATVDDLILLPLPLGGGWSEGLPDPNFLNCSGCFFRVQQNGVSEQFQFYRR
jgi:hypothetical protein